MNDKITKAFEKWDRAKEKYDNIAIALLKIDEIEEELIKIKNAGRGTYTAQDVANLIQRKEHARKELRKLDNSVFTETNARKDLDRAFDSLEYDIRKELE